MKNCVTIPPWGFFMLLSMSSYPLNRVVLHSELPPVAFLRNGTIVITELESSMTSNETFAMNDGVYFLLKSPPPGFSYPLSPLQLNTLSKFFGTVFISTFSTEDKRQLLIYHCLNLWLYRNYPSFCAVTVTTAKPSDTQIGKGGSCPGINDTVFPYW